jgi:hypothetical protein
MIVWEVETGSVPYEGLDEKEVRRMLEQKLRPMIPEGTDENLSLLIRRCWQDASEKRPNFGRIIKYLEDVKFSSN